MTSVTGHTALLRYRVKRADRAAGYVKVGDVIYPGRDGYGCANEDTRNFGIEHCAYSQYEAGWPFFTMPREDVEAVTDDQQS